MADRNGSPSDAPRPNGSPSDAPRTKQRGGKRDFQPGRPPLPEDVKLVKTSVQLPPALRDQVDEDAKGRRQSRSERIVDILEEHYKGARHDELGTEPA